MSLSRLFGGLAVALVASQFFVWCFLQRVEVESVDEWAAVVVANMVVSLVALAGWLRAQR